MRKTIALAICLGCAALMSGATRHTTYRHKVPVRHVAATRKSAPPRRTAPSWRSGQTQPDSERVREIQEALVKKGYLSQEATGTWSEESTDALRRFQKDQNLDPNGKLDSLSIIALGLGPQYAASRP